MMKLSIIIPVYNEETTLAEIIARVRATGLAQEIVVVDDGSADSSPAILSRLQNSDHPPLRLLRHERNRGKGAAMRTGLAAVTGDLVLVQDADLEYDPADYPALLGPFADPTVEVVYGSRNLRRNPHSSFTFYWGGRLLSWVANWLYGAHITDEATGYKVIKTELLRDIGLETDGFEFCPEVTGKLLQRGVTIHEAPISYNPRSWAEGKKIQWYDGLIAIWTLIKYRFFMGKVNEKTQSQQRQDHHWVMTGIILLAALLRLSWLGTQSIAFDESFSLAVGLANWPTLFQAILSDGVHPPLFYIIHKGALALWGVSEFGQRFSAAVFSLISIALVYQAGRVIFNRNIGLLSALLLALNPLHIWLAQEARMYSLLGALAIISMTTFWQAIRTNRRLYWGALAVVNSIVFLLHYFGFLIPTIQFVFIVLTFRHNYRRLRPWAAVQTVAFLPLLPWLIATALRDIQTFGIGFLIRPSVLDFFVTFWNLTLGSSNLFWSASILTIIVTGLALIVALRPMAPHKIWPKQGQQLVGLWVLLLPLITWLVSQRRSFYADRYLSFAIPGLTLLLAFGVTRVARLRWRILLIGGLIVASGYGLAATRLDPAFQKDDWRSAVAYIAHQEQPEDVILLYTTHIRFSFDYYYHGHTPRKPISLNLENFPVESLTTGYHRAWVVYPYTRRPTHYPFQPLLPDGYWDDDPDRNPLLVKWFETHADEVIDYQHFQGIEMWLVDLDTANVRSEM